MTKVPSPKRQKIQHPPLDLTFNTLARQEQIALATGSEAGSLITEPASPRNSIRGISPNRDGGVLNKDGSPARPLSPSIPVVKPRSPIKLLNPASPSKLNKPASPSKVVKPASPIKLLQPASPSKVVKPASPSKLNKPASPSKVTKPASPSKLTKPSQPTKLNKPASPSKLNKPASPSRAAHPASPKKVVKPGSPRKITNPDSFNNVAQSESPNKISDLAQSDGEPVPLLIGKYTVENGVASWSGTWGFNMVAFKEGKTSKFAFQSKSSSGALSLSGPINGAYDGFFDFEVPDASSMRIPEKELMLCFKPMSAKNQFNVQGTGVNRFGKFTVRGSLVGNELSLSKIYTS